MKTFLSAWWERLSTSYWFIPSVMTIVATAFSFATVHIDSMINTKWARTAGWIWAGGPEGARNVLATVAGSTITVAGVELLGHTGFIGAFAFHAPDRDAVLVGTHNDSDVDRWPLLTALCRELPDAA